MKILVLSDSHGNIENMMRAVEQEQPEMLIHLGDCWRDGQRLAEHYPNIPMTQVPGNCDFRSHEAMEKLLFIEKYRVLICHGHTYGVKQSLLPAGLAAEEQKADLSDRKNGAFLRENEKLNMCFEKQTKAFGRNKGVLRFFISLDMEIRRHTTSG